MFTVVMSVYVNDQPVYFTEALTSLVSCQNLLPCEIVLVQDGALSEALLRVISDFKDKSPVPLNVIALSQNVGAGRARNIGIEAATTDIIAIMDSDDVCLADRFSLQYEFMISHPEVTVCGAQVREMDEGMLSEIAVRQVPVKHFDIAHLMKTRSPISNPVAMFRREAVLAVGGYESGFAEDYFLWAKLLVAGYKFHNLPEILLNMRTGDTLLQRRGVSGIGGILRVYRFLYSKGVTTFAEYLLNSLLQIGFRLTPVFVKRLLYKYARKTLIPPRI